MKDFLLIRIVLTCLLAVAPGLSVSLAGPGIPAASLGAETIRRVKLVLDGTVYLWEAGQTRPERLDGQFQDPGLPLHLAGFAPGQNWASQDLLRQIAQARRLLEQTRLYNEALVLLVPSRSDPEQCSIVLQISTGFSLRFGGGAAWAMVGDDNADGAALGWRVWGGYNQAGGRLGQGLPGMSEAWWQTDLLYTNNGLDGPEDTDWIHSGRLEARAGTAAYPWKAGMDLLASLDAGPGVAGASAGTAVTDWTLRVRPHAGLDYTLDLDSVAADGDVTAAANALDLGLDLGAWGALAWSSAPDGSPPVGSVPGLPGFGGLDARVYARFRTGPLTLASQLVAGMSAGALPDRLAADWRNTADRSVRGDYSRDHLLLDHALLWSTEIRLELLKTSAGFISSLGLETFLFADTLTGGRRTASTSPALWFDRLATAFGPGLRLLLGSPVNTDFTLALGMNPEIFVSPALDEPPLRLVFTVSAGF